MTKKKEDAIKVDVCCGCLSNPILPTPLSYTHTHTLTSPPIFFFSFKEPPFEWLLPLCTSVVAKFKKKTRQTTNKHTKEKRIRQKHTQNVYKDSDETSSDEWWLDQRNRRVICAHSYRSWPFFSYMKQGEEKKIHFWIFPYVCIHGRRPSSSITHNTRVYHEPFGICWKFFFFFGVLKYFIHRDCHLIDSCPSTKVPLLASPTILNGKDRVASLS